MIKARIITKYIATSDGLEPDIPAGLGMSDVTGKKNPVAGDAVVVEVESVSQAALSGTIILWSEEIQNAAI
jgi:hypothetical protein